MTKNKKYLISSDKNTNAFLHYLSVNTGRPASFICAELARALFAVGSMMEPNFNYWVFVNGTEVTIQFVGTPSIISGSIQGISDAEGENKLENEIDSKLLGQKLTFEEHEDRVCITGEIQKAGGE